MKGSEDREWVHNIERNGFLSPFERGEFWVGEDERPKKEQIARIKTTPPVPLTTLSRIRLRLKSTNECSLYQIQMALVSFQRRRDGTGTRDVHF